MAKLFKIYQKELLKDTQESLGKISWDLAWNEMCNFVNFLMTLQVLYIKPSGFLLIFTSERGNVKQFQENNLSQVTWGTLKLE